MKAAVRVGDLRHRIVIERAVRTNDDAGGATLDWEAVAEVSAAIWPREAGESYGADHVAGKATHDIWMRYRSDVTPDMRVRCGTRVFDILGAIDVEDRGRWLKCPAEERNL
jgi:SPP1 family predicted phage head-tail adaptor